MTILRTCLLAMVLSCGVAPAWAHKPSDSYLTLEDAAGNDLAGQWDIALRDLDHAIGLDGDGDGRLTWSEVRARHAAIAAYALARLSVARGGAACALRAGGQLVDRHTDGTYTVLRFAAVCPRPGALVLGYRLFADTDPQHKGLAAVHTGGATHTLVLGTDHPEARLDGGAGRGAAAFLRDGVRHIWTGYDHVLFLLSLLLPAVLARRAGRWQPATRPGAAAADVLRVVTAFTVAHSVTLSAATLGIVSLPSRWVEAAIALSVLLAALNNILPLAHGRRWAAAFGFGLVHGFGFASVLSGLGLRPGALVRSLVAFNAGVELGQIAIVLAFLPLAWMARGSWFYRRVVLVGASGAIMCIAAAWLGERLLDVRLLPG